LQVGKGERATADPIARPLQTYKALNFKREGVLIMNKLKRFEVWFNLTKHCKTIVFASSKDTAMATINQELHNGHENGIEFDVVKTEHDVVLADEQGNKPNALMDDKAIMRQAQTIERAEARRAMSKL
jgi:hypothetical protein